MAAASRSAVVARVSVSDTEFDVLFLVAQYLRDLGLSTSVVALLRETGLDPTWLCGPSREIALLREWVFQGEWPRVRALLGPLGDVLGQQGLAVALARVDKQALLEEFHSTWTTPLRRREIIEQLQTSTIRLARHELEQCMGLLKGELPRDSVWSLDEARLACFESLVPLFRDAIEVDDEEHKYLTMPRRQLVALLNDALLLHKQQTSSTGGYGDLVSLTPISNEAVVPGDEELNASSLRLVESDHKDGVGNALTRSVDLSRLQRRDHVNGTKAHERNPLVMSMAFQHGRRGDLRGESLLQVVQTTDDQASQTESMDKEDQLDSVGGRNESISVQSAETQTETIMSVDQAVATIEQPALETMNLLVSHAGDEDSDRDPLSPGNQASDTANHDLTGRSPLVLQESKDMMVAIVNGPLEAWCTSRRGKAETLNDGEHREKLILENEYNTQAAAPDKTSAPYEDESDRPERADSDKDEDENANAPLRLYSELTVDSIVRASVVAEVREAQAIRAMDIAPDGSELVIGTNARALRVFDLTEPLASSSLTNSGGLSFLPLLPVTLERHKHHASSIYTACYNHVSPAHATPLIATGAAESSIKVLARWTQQEVWIRGHNGKSRALHFASPSILCSAASGDMVIRAWDLEASSPSGPPCVQRFDGHVGEIQALAITSTGSQETSGPMDRRCFVSTSMDRTVRLWDMRSSQCARVLARVESPAFTLALQPSSSAGTTLATGHQDGSVSLWDLRASSYKTTKPITTVSLHQDECRAVSWSPDGHWLMSASFDGTLGLMEAARRELSAVASFHQHEDKILQAKWHPTQPAIVTTGADKLLKLWAFT